MVWTILRRSIRQVDISFLGGGVPVGVPSAAFQFKGASGHDLLCVLIAFGAFDLVGIYADKFFRNFTTGTFKFVYWHG
jgi:hypothetical protein